MRIIRLLACLLVTTAAQAEPPWNQIGRVDLKPDGTPSDQPGQHRFEASISDDGRWIIFSSSAADLVPGDTNGSPDIFARDMSIGTTVRLSVRPGGGETTGGSLLPAASSDGRFVAFLSFDDQLVADDTNFELDVFLLDRDADNDGIFDNGGGTIERVSVNDTGGQLVTGAKQIRGDVSDDGLIVAFATLQPIDAGDNNGEVDVYVRDLDAGQTEAASVSTSGIIGDDESPHFFGDPIQTDASGNWVGFNSTASNLVPGDSNSDEDAFVRDRAAGQTTRVSVGPGGAQIERDTRRIDISRDGGWAVFEQFTDLVGGDPNPDGSDTYIHELATGEITRVNFDAGTFAKAGATCCGNQSPRVSNHRAVVAFQSSQNFVFESGNSITTTGRADAFVNTLLGTTRITDFPVPLGVDDGWSAFPIGMSHNGAYLLVMVSSAGDQTTPEEGLFLYQREVLFVGNFD